MHTTAARNADQQELMPANSHFELLLENNHRALLALQADAQALSKATKALNVCEELELLHKAVLSRPESETIKAGIREYHLALHQATLANYRTAYISLRLSAELFLAQYTFPHLR